MMKKIFATALFAAVLAFSAYADKWDDLISDASSNALSKAKMKTSSGKRIMREKLQRIETIDRQVRAFSEAGDNVMTESVLTEALKLTIEYYGYNDLRVSERFISLGIFYMDISRPELAEPVFLRAENIGEKILGASSYKLMNVYRFLAVCYFQQGKADMALEKAVLFRAVAVKKFGEASKEAKDAQELVSTVKSEMTL